MTASHEYTPANVPAIFRGSSLIADGDCPCCGTPMTEPPSQPSPGMPATYRTRAHIHPAGSPLRNDADWFFACARCNADQGHLSLSEWAAVLTMRADERAARVKALVSNLGGAGASITRRSALGLAGKAAVGVLAGVGVAHASTGSVDPEISAAIEAHRVASDAVIDHYSNDPCADPQVTPTAEVEAAWSAEGDRLLNADCDTAFAILEIEPSDMASIAAVLAYVAERTRAGVLWPEREREPQEAAERVYCNYIGIAFDRDAIAWAARHMQRLAG